VTGASLPPPRASEQRRRDALAQLASRVDVWVASAGSEGRAHLVPLSYHWDGARLTLATPRASRTGRNLLRAGWARVALEPTRDVVLLEGPVELLEIGGEPELEEAFARSAGFDPRAEAEEYVYLRITPERVQAWREENELAGRDLMRDGVWLV
jgi:Pyridoxamine 5'-phosphate oxidase